MEQVFADKLGRLALVLLLVEARASHPESQDNC
jgi:hypothetical protein